MVVDEEPGLYTFAMHRNVNVFVWVGSATGALTERVGKIVANQVAHNTRGLSTVHVMTPLASPPSAEARRGFAEIGQRHLSSIVSVSLVIEREGFWGSAMRSAVTGIQLLLQCAEYPIKVHSSIAETAAWMPLNHLARSGVRLDAVEFLSALQTARAYTIERAGVTPEEVVDLSHSA